MFVAKAPLGLWYYIEVQQHIKLPKTNWPKTHRLKNPSHNYSTIVFSFCFIKMGHPRSLFRSFQPVLQSNIVDHKRIRTQIVRIEGKHAGNWTPPTSPLGAAIAQWIRLHPSILMPTGSTPKHAIHAFIIYSQICVIFVLNCEKNENKQKEAGFGPFLKKIALVFFIC